ncbi:MAG: YkuS family protein [Clostridia bacterium]|nr:YkuS family protein [Clostridia bacterium]
MKQKIAIEANLTPIKDYLSNKGFQVESVDISPNSAKEAKQGFDKYDAFVVTGLNSNFLGIQDTTTKAVVIDATGLTPDEVYSQLKNRLS